MTECDILMYLFAAFSVAGCGWIFIAARIRQRYTDEIRLLKEEIQCEERRFNQLWDDFARLSRRYEIIKSHALDLRKKNQDLQAEIAKLKEQA